MFEGISVIALSGFKHSGKSSIASEMVRLLGERGITSKVFSFAGRPKEVLSTLIGTEDWEKDDVLYIDEERDRVVTARHFLMYFCTEFAQTEIGRRVWVDIVTKSILRWREEKCPNEPCVIVIDDYRFPHEYDFIKHFGFSALIMRASAQQEALAIRQDLGEKAEHSSEDPENLPNNVSVSNEGTITEAAEEILAVTGRLSGFPDGGR